MFFEQRMFARLKFFEKILELSENAFEDFFHNLMSARHPDYVDVRTHGNIGDKGADGLGLHDRKLYACYAPPTFNVSEIESKFASDLKKAKEKRDGEFDTFVFVHNDMRGAHPEISSVLAEAGRDHAPLKFDHMGRRRLWHEVLKLNVEQVEDLLGCPIPITQLAYGIGMEDLAPLLEHLKDQAKFSDPLKPVPPVSELKLDYNRLDGDSRESLVKAFRSTRLIDQYYTMRMAAYERDEVAAGFSIYYQQIKEDWEDPEDIIWQLEMYVLGNMHQDRRTHRAAMVVLAYFFERCDIFEQPPPDWRPASVAGSST
ncbi:ABC-three component system protein [Actinoallomurus acanthiterrae]